VGSGCPSTSSRGSPQKKKEKKKYIMAGFAPPPAQLAGMAGEIRGAMDSEQFDLAGYNEQRVTDLMTSAFPLSPRQLR